jgi:hypothetical protein
MLGVSKSAWPPIHLRSIDLSLKDGRSLWTIFEFPNLSRATLSLDDTWSHVGEEQDPATLPQQISGFKLDYLSIKAPKPSQLMDSFLGSISAESISLYFDEGDMGPTIKCLAAPLVVLQLSLSLSGRGEGEPLIINKSTLAAFTNLESLTLGAGIVMDKKLFESSSLSKLKFLNLRQGLEFDGSALEKAMRLNSLPCLQSVDLSALLDIRDDDGEDGEIYGEDYHEGSFSERFLDDRFGEDRFKWPTGCSRRQVKKVVAQAKRSGISIDGAMIRVVKLFSAYAIVNEKVLQVKIERDRLIEELEEFGKAIKEKL